MRMSERPVDREFKSHQPHIFSYDCFFLAERAGNNISRNFLIWGWQDSDPYFLKKNRSDMMIVLTSRER